MEILISLVAIVLSVIALSKSSDTLLKIDRLEKRMKEGQGATQSIPSLVASVTADTENILTKDESDSLKYARSSVSKNEDYKDSAFVVWLKEDWLLKLGGTLVLMGVLFFLSLAFTAVGPLGKVSIGYIFGVLLMFFGFKYAKKNIVGGGTIHVVGAVVILITTYLARQPEYNLFNPYVATMLMFLTSTCVALTAYAYNRTQLAHVGLFLAAAVPMLTNTESNNFARLLVYLGIVTLGTLWLALMTKWRTLVLLALGIVCVYSLIKLSTLTNGASLTFTENYLIVAFGILFYVTSLFSILRSRGVTEPADGAVAVLNAGFVLLWVTSQASSDIAPIIIAFIALVYAVGFFFVYKITDIYTSFIVYGGVSLGLLTTAIMLHLSGRAETVALLLIGAGVTVFTQYLSNNDKLTKPVAFFNILPLAYVFKSAFMINYSNNADAWADIMIILLASSLYYILYGYFRDKSKELWQISLFAGFSFSVVAIWDVLHLTVGGGFATFLSIVIYTIVGLVVLFQGVEEKNFTKISLAKTWMGLVAARVIFWDAWQVGGITMGVLICIVIGILLLSSTFILKKVTTE